MWAATTLRVPPPTPPINPSMISIAKSPPLPEGFLTSATPTTAHTWRSRHRISATSDDVGGLGRAVLSAAIRSSTPKTQNPVSNPPQGKEKGKQKQEEPKREEKGKEMSGSDILWALQKASARKAQIKKQQRQRRILNRRDGVEGNAGRVVDFDTVRPVTVKSDWAARLDDLQKRLEEFLSF